MKSAMTALASPGPWQGPRGQQGLHEAANRFILKKDGVLEHRPPAVETACPFSLLSCRRSFNGQRVA